MRARAMSSLKGVAEPPRGPADFTKQYVQLRTDPARLFGYLRLIKPEACREVFSPEVAPEVLRHVAIAIGAHASAETARWCAQWLDGLSACARFEMTLLMLEAGTRRALTDMFGALGPIAAESAEVDLVEEIARLRAKFGV